METLLRAARSTNRDPCPGPTQERWAKDAGFVNVEHKVFKLPIGPWPMDPKLKEIGLFNLAQLLAGLEGISLRLVVGVLGRSNESLQALLTGVRKELKDSRIHMMYNL